MRQVINSCYAVFFFFSAASSLLAEGLELTTEMMSYHSKVNENKYSEVGVIKTTQLGLKKNFSGKAISAIGVAVNSVERDLSKFFVEDPQAKRSNFAELGYQPWSSQLGVSLEANPSSRLDYNQSFQEDPFFVRQLKYTHTVKYQKYASVWQSSIGVGQLTSPDSYFIDGFYDTKALPEKTTTSEYRSSFEHPLLNKTKIKYELAALSYASLRPLTLSAIIQGRHALTYRNFVGLRYERTRDQHNKSIQDNTGLRDLHSFQGSFSTEPWIDILISISYGLTMESVATTDDLLLSDQNLRASHIGYAVSWRLSDMDVALQGASVAGVGEDYQLSTLGGSLTWRM